MCKCYTVLHNITPLNYRQMKGLDQEAKQKQYFIDVAFVEGYICEMHLQ